jgi:cyclophilin family peptidyl-prolyl cis-trans isomerase
VRLAPAVLALVLALGVAPACGGDDSSSSAAGGETAATSQAQGTECEPAEGKTKPDGTLSAPTEKLDPNKTYSLVFDTNCGSFTVELDQKLAPKTTASLVSLANQDFFDDTMFHRIVPGFVIQGGDPTASGLGGPGYKTVDPPPQTAKYTHGVVAMAKAGNEAPGTSGSQFFVVTADDAGLPPDYAVVGKVTAGLDVVDKIGTLGDAAEHPTETVVIEDVAVETS